MQKRNKREKQGKKEKRLLCVTAVSFFLRNRDTKNRKHKIYGKRIDKTDISRYSDKVGLKSHKKVKKQEKKFRIII